MLLLRHVMFLSQPLWSGSLHIRLLSVGPLESACRLVYTKLDLVFGTFPRRKLFTKEFDWVTDRPTNQPNNQPTNQPTNQLACLLAHSLTARSRVFHAKLIVAHLVKKLPPFCRIRNHYLVHKNPLSLQSWAR
jgi:hypothetical protein